MALDWLFERMRSFASRPAAIWRGRTLSYGDLLERSDSSVRELPDESRAVLLLGDWSPGFLAHVLGLLRAGKIAAPVARAMRGQLDEFCRIAAIESLLEFDEADRPTLRSLQPDAEPPLYRRLRLEGASGLVVFSSGTTGAPKAILHDADRLTAKHRDAQTTLRSLALPPPDHMAGLDTLFYSLAGGGLLVIPEDRSPDAVCGAIAGHRVELLPTTPSFLNLLLVSAAASRHDLTSLRIVTYGSEVMPESTLQRARTLLPGCRFIQKYGTTEFGSPRTRSREDGSVWFRMDSPGYEFKIVDGTLWVRSSSSMIGYLNAPNPFDEDGWMNTGDLVEKDGDYIRVLGRKTDLINVGGHKVLPQEVEDVILRMDNVSDVAVTAEKNAMMGQVVAAHVTLSAPEDANGFKARLRAHCRQHLPSYKIPVRVEIADAPLAGARMKKSRLPAGQPET